MLRSKMPLRQGYQNVLSIKFCSNRPGSTIASCQLDYVNVTVNNTQLNNEVRQAISADLASNNGSFQSNLNTSVQLLDVSSTDPGIGKSSNI